jgi:hypothetical protein
VTGFELIYYFTIRTLFDKLADKMAQTEKNNSSGSGNGKH